MGTLTKYNALVGELEPYTPSRLALQKALADVKISDWVEKFIPAKQRLGTDGQMYSYTFDVFLPSYFEGDLSIGARVEVTLERGGVDEFTISGIDDTNPKYIEIWG